MLLKCESVRLLSQGSLPDLRHRRHWSAELADFESALLDLVRQFEAPDHDSSGLEAPQSKHRTKPLLHSPVVLFDGVVEVLAGPHSHSFRQLAISSEICNRPAGCGIDIQRDLGRNPLSRHGFAQKGFGCVLVARQAQDEIHGLSRFVDCPVEIPNIRLIHPPGAANRAGIPLPRLSNFGESCCTQRRIVVCAILMPRSLIIATRS